MTRRRRDAACISGTMFSGGTRLRAPRALSISAGLPERPAMMQPPGRGTCLAPGPGSGPGPGPGACPAPGPGVGPDEVTVLTNSRMSRAAVSSRYTVRVRSKMTVWWPLMSGPTMRAVSRADATVSRGGKETRPARAVKGSASSGISSTASILRSRSGTEISRRSSRLDDRCAPISAAITSPTSMAVPKSTNITSSAVSTATKA